MAFLRLFQLAEDRIEGETVFLRYPQASDFSEWAALRLLSKDFLTPWEPLWQDDDYSRMNFRSRVKHYEYLVKTDAAYPFFIFHKDSDKLLGAITLNNIRRGISQMATLGYWIGAPHARQGYMTQAINTLLHYAFTQFGLHRLEAACLPHNLASRAVLKHCQFEQEGYAKSYLKIAGHWQDHLLFARINPAPNSTPHQ